MFRGAILKRGEVGWDGGKDAKPAPRSDFLLALLFFQLMLPRCCLGLVYSGSGGKNVLRKKCVLGCDERRKERKRGTQGNESELGEPEEKEKERRVIRPRAGVSPRLVPSKKHARSFASARKNEPQPFSNSFSCQHSRAGNERNPARYKKFAIVKKYISKFLKVIQILDRFQY